MQALAQFAGLTLRPVEAHDRPALESWIEQDEAHRECVSADFFMGLDENGQPDGRATCYVIQDADGEIFYIRLSRASRVNIQFAPEASREQRERNRDALIKGMAFLEGLLCDAGAEEWIFETKTPALRAMALKRMGFVESPRELRRVIPSPEAMRKLYGAVLPEQTIEKETV
jgi:hypothetical protein